MKEIELTQGKVTLVDDEDYQKVFHDSYHAHEAKKGKFYARRSDGEMMHRVIMDAPHDLLVDHIDGDGLNNQKYNLRICTHAQNLKNRKANKNSKTGYKGVFPYRNGYMAQIMADGKKVYLGTFDNDIEAAKVYDEAARERFGIFAKTNF